MAVQTHLKIVFRGIFTASPESWSFSTKWRRIVDIGPDAGVDDVGETGVTTAITNYIHSFQFQNNVACTEWRAYQIGTDNTMEGEPKLVDLSSSPPTGQGTARSYPTDVALCVTTEGTERGHGKFGRFYVPGPHAQLDANRQITTSWADAFMADTVTFLKAVSDSIDLPGTVDSSVMLNISDDATSTAQVVNNIRVGRVLDRISRRRNQMDEDYRVSGVIDW